jgi:hypothetical protein
MDRQEGYYWVKYDEKYQVGYWNGKFWTLIGLNYPFTFTNSAFEHINENRIKEPGELPD